MSKRIEVGCLVVIIDADAQDLIGKTGIAAERITGEKFNQNLELKDMTGWWRIDGIDGEKMKVARPASSLLRIDDYTEKTETQEEECEV